MKITIESVGKAAVYTTFALIVLGLIKNAMPDVWSKVPGLNAF